MTTARFTALFIILIFLATQSGMVIAVPDSPGAIITVNATGDTFGEPENDSTCSLREAIQSANTDTAFGGCTAGDLGTDTIVLGSAIYYMYGTPGDEANAFGDFDVLSPIVIQGLGIQQTIIDGNSIDRLFHVHETGSLSLNNLTLQHGQAAEDGGAILNEKTVILQNVSLLSNQALRNGGAYATLATTTLAPRLGPDDSLSPPTKPISFSCTQCYIQYNTANGSGGGIYSDNANLALTDVYMESNVADEDDADGGDGGAIYNRDNGDRNIDDCQFINNATKNGSGGAIYNDLGGYLYITDSYFRENTAKMFGGALFNGLGAHYELERVEISNNSATETSSGGSGGGIFNLGSLETMNVTIAGNHSANKGAGIYTNANLDVVSLAFSTIANNEDGDLGGPGDGIFAESGLVYAHGLIVAWNGSSTGDGNNCVGTIITQNDNLESGATCAFTGSDLIKTDPRLGPFGVHNTNNLTQTFSLLFDSQAIDVNDGSGCPSVDQRNFTRPRVGSHSLFCDAGAYETDRPMLFLPLVIRP